MVPVIRVLVADDHPVFLRGLAAALNATPDIRIVGMVTEGRRVAPLAAELAPDVVLMDVQMPDLDGVSAAREVHALVPSCRVLALSGFDMRQIVIEMLEAGAVGYVLKDGVEEEIVAAVRAAMAGEIYVSPRLRADVPQRLLTPGTFDPPRLTVREAQVLRLVAQGMPRKQLADRLGVSPKTVEFHVHQVMLRLEMESIADVIRYATARGWLGQPGTLGPSGSGHPPRATR
jgi:DNA-binding NarL/FixJ family response regulator